MAWDSQNLNERLSVKRTRSFNIKEPTERVEFAISVTTIILHQLAQRHACREMAAHLRDVEDA
jgi:chromosome condensin MukBEF complex kleisin-like MukF subunit